MQYCTNPIIPRVVETMLLAIAITMEKFNLSARQPTWSHWASVVTNEARWPFSNTRSLQREILLWSPPQILGNGSGYVHVYFGIQA